MIGLIFCVFLLAGIDDQPVLASGNERNINERTTTERNVERFEKQIRPVLVDECIRCHGPDKQQANLRLDSRIGWKTGGDSGPAIVPGDRDSLMLQVMRYEHSDYEMPPRGKLPDEVIQAFEAWIEAGADDPRGQMPASIADQNQSRLKQTAVDLAKAKSFWSFQSVKNPPVPDVSDDHWSSGAIDRFVLSNLRDHGLAPSPPAEPSVLLRRVYYDLIGLPPTPEQLTDFLADPSPSAYRTVIDRLLDSEQFGQRWGRHWLDVVRYAESSGGGRTLMFPNAWRYRDYVIESFNDDVPYDQFVTQQLAGDLLDEPDWQQRRKNLIATAFLLLGPTNYELQDKDVLEMDVVDEQLDTMGKALMGMTIGCARCHDHKFDPIPAHDYYAMAGVLKSSQSLLHDNVSTWNKVALPQSPQQQRTLKSLTAKLKAAKAELNAKQRTWVELGGKPELTKGQKSIPINWIPGIVVDNQDAETIGNWTESEHSPFFVAKNYLYGARKPGRVTYRPSIPRPGSYEVRVSYSPGENRATNAKIQIQHRDGISSVTIDQQKKPTFDGQFVSLGIFPFESGASSEISIQSDQSSDGVVIADAVVLIRQSDAKDQSESIAENDARLESLSQEMKRLRAEIERIETALPKPEYAMSIADSDQPRDIHLAIRGATHQKGELTPRGVMQIAAPESFPPIAEDQSGRRELAAWIVDPKHPLTSRVMVNRVWNWLIGQGIVPTVDNFGTMGQPPSDDQLLDHLATKFVADGWSIKRLIQRIVTSQTYQQDSATRRNPATVDPANRLLWRMNRKRLRAEDIRDTMLMVSGELDLTHGGKTIKPGTKGEYDYEFTGVRRSVYVPVFRNTLPEIFEVFDFADPNIQRGRRSTSTVSSQALWMMNHPFVIQRCETAAKRLVQDDESDYQARIDHACRQVLGRPANDAERTIALDLIDDLDQNDASGWAMLYQVLFQSLDFRYLN